VQRYPRTLPANKSLVHTQMQTVQQRAQKKKAPSTSSHWGTAENRINFCTKHTTLPWLEGRKVAWLQIRCRHRRRPYDSNLDDLSLKDQYQTTSAAHSLLRLGDGSTRRRRDLDPFFLSHTPRSERFLQFHDVVRKNSNWSRPSFRAVQKKKLSWGLIHHLDASPGLGLTNLACDLCLVPWRVGVLVCLSRTTLAC
jgi:hypothetical protein